MMAESIAAFLFVCFIAYIIAFVRWVRDMIREYR